MWKSQGIEKEVPAEVNAAAQEVEKENLQNMVHGLDQLFIDNEVPIGSYKSFGTDWNFLVTDQAEILRQASKTL